MPGRSAGNTSPAPSLSPGTGISWTGCGSWSSPSCTWWADDGAALARDDRAGGADRVAHGAGLRRDPDLRGLRDAPDRLGGRRDPDPDGRRRLVAAGPPRAAGRARSGPTAPGRGPGVAGRTAGRQ